MPSSMATSRHVRGISKMAAGQKVEDCVQCKIVGAGGCFAASLYALHQRTKAPAPRNKFMLLVISVVACGLGVARLVT